MTVRVSVVTHYFNAGATLEECIRSVLGQSFADFEHLLVNNCSTDDSPPIAKRLAATDSRIRLVDNVAFLGRVDNYNAALARVVLQDRSGRRPGGQGAADLYPVVLSIVVPGGNLSMSGTSQETPSD